jgi:hypothetical protein
VPRLPALANQTRPSGSVTAVIDRTTAGSADLESLSSSPLAPFHQATLPCESARIPSPLGQLGNAPQLFTSTRSPYRPPNSIAADPVTGMANVAPMRCERDAWIVTSAAAREGTRTAEKHESPGQRPEHSSVEVLAAYSHSAQAADLQLCHTYGRGNIVGGGSMGSPMRLSVSPMRIRT